MVDDSDRDAAAAAESHSKIFEICLTLKFRINVNMMTYISNFSEHQYIIFELNKNQIERFPLWYSFFEWILKKRRNVYTFCMYIFLEDIYFLSHKFT